MTIDELLNPSESFDWNLQVTSRVPADILDKIDADLLKILAAEREGKTIPGRMKLVRYFTESYGYPLGKSAVIHRLNQLRKKHGN